jgi:hypothetical protein
MHGCTIAEIESLLRRGAHGFPRKIGDGKWIIEGRGDGGRMIRVIFVRDPDRTVFVIHAMPLITRRRRR